MRISKQKGSILVEGLIVMTIINIMVMLIFSYIRFIAVNTTERTHQERATLFMVETFEKIRSARDTAVNINKKTGWDSFIKNINKENNAIQYSLVEASELAGKLEIVPETKENAIVFSSEVAPYADYTTDIQASFATESGSINTNIIVFDVLVRWRDFESDDEPSLNDLSYIRQSLTLTNNTLYENLF